MCRSFLSAAGKKFKRKLQTMKRRQRRFECKTLNIARPYYPETETDGMNRTRSLEAKFGSLVRLENAVDDVGSDGGTGTENR